MLFTFMVLHFVDAVRLGVYLFSRINYACLSQPATPNWGIYYCEKFTALIISMHNNTLVVASVIAYDFYSRERIRTS